MIINAKLQHVTSGESARNLHAILICHLASNFTEIISRFVYLKFRCFDSSTIFCLVLFLHQGQMMHGSALNDT